MKSTRSNARFSFSEMLNALICYSKDRRGLVYGRGLVRLAYRFCQPFARIADMASTKVSVKVDDFGRVLIPKRVRGRLGLEAGQELALSLEGCIG